MIVYRIIVEVGYKEVALEFQNVEDAGDFARIFLTHAKLDKDSHKPKISLDVIDTDSVKEDEEDE